MEDLTIIIPVYNEEENLPFLEKELLKYLPNLSKPASVLFINDGSTDHSEALLTEICRRSEMFNYLSLRTNCGLSGALKAGFDKIKTTYIGYMDADLQTHPEDFNLLLKFVPQYEMVIGIRTKRMDSTLKKFSSRFANGFRRLFTGDGIIDTGCPLKIFKTESARQIPMFKGTHRFLPAMVQLQGGQVKQVPITHYARKYGKVKFGLGNRIFGPFIFCFIFLWMKRNYINYRIKESNLE